MKYLVVGAKGFVGEQLYKALKAQDSETVGTHYCRSDDLKHLDLADPNLEFPIDSFSHAFILGGVGSPKKCEEEPRKTFQSNVEGPLKFAHHLLEKGVVPIFFSSRYVFDGAQECYSTAASPSPMNSYGVQKAELEKRAEQELDGKYLMVRLEKVYGTTRGDGTLFDAITSSLLLGKKVYSVGDQKMAPIAVKDVIDGTLKLIQEGKLGVYNFASPSPATRYEMALHIAEKIGCPSGLVERISLEDLKDGVSRPKGGYLISDIPASSWMEGVNKVVRNYGVS